MPTRRAARGVSGSLRFDRPQRLPGRLSRRDLIRAGGITVAGVGGAILLGCGGGETGSGGGGGGGEPQQGGNIRMATLADANTLDPAFSLSTADIGLAVHLFDNLIQQQRDLSLKPMLAESWESEDLQHWTFKLRQGATFSHGKPFTADDVVFTFERLLDPDVGSPGRSSLSFIDRVEKVDDHTVSMTLTGPNAFLPQTLSLYQGRILPSDVDPGEFATQARGTGPFRLQEYEPGERAVATRNPDYWDAPAPYAETLTVYYIPEPIARAEQMRAGAVDAVFPLEPSQALSLQGTPGVVVDEVASGSYLNLAMFCDVEPFSDIRVRHALRAITNRETVREAVLFGGGELANDHPISPDDAMWWPDQQIPEQDLDEARKLLDAAGFGNGLTLTLHTSTLVAGILELAVTYRELAAPAGVNIEIQRVSEDAYYSTTWLIEPFLAMGWNARNPDEALSIVYHSDAAWNEGHYYNPTLDALMESARGIADEDERRESYGDIQRILIEDVPRIIPVFRPIYAAHAENLHGFGAHPSNWPLFHDAWFDA
ncbi:MAG: ABC transporter substrate-binding protein [Dehalococcoidia bacterium]